MNELTLKRITELQKAYGVTGTQEGINSEMLEAGVCVLPNGRRTDYYGNIVPSRDDLKPGTKGTLLNCQTFWQMVEDGNFETIESLEETFGVQKE
jgi:hypothetical protein